MTERVLIVDDDEKLRKLLSEYLEGYGYAILSLADGSNVMTTVESEQPDIVILDIMLPQKNGLEVLRDIRNESKLPVIMLTAKGEDADRIVGLEMGADDYLPKPFNPRELLARIKAVLRRAVPDQMSALERDKSIFIKAGGLVLNKAKLTLMVEDKEVDLSSTEYKIMKALMERPNRVLTRDQLMNLAHGRDLWPLIGVWMFTSAN